MALFDKFRQMLIPEEERKKKEYPVKKQDADRNVRVAQLTPREHDLYLLLLQGFTLKESAQQLSVKYSTANTHMTSIYKKLGVKSRAELIINYRDVGGENSPDASKP